VGSRWPPVGKFRWPRTDIVASKEFASREKDQEALPELRELARRSAGPGRTETATGSGCHELTAEVSLRSGRTIGTSRTSIRRAA
jgi:hypothetical protein